MVAILLAFADEETRSKYERLYVRYGNPLYRITFSILKEEHLAQDALQECFIKIFLNLDHIEDIDSYRTKAYLTAVAKTAAINLYRKEKGVRDVTEPEETSLYDVESDFNMEEILANAELSKNLKKYVTELEPMDKNIILLKYFYSHSDRQIAEKTGISHGNVRIRLMRARQKLAGLISKGGDILDRT
ncbi:MAG TPA: sigma-70 family RNA polymerase sigma factor [Anaerovoracaceae bacterium]|nr:sigma-70 family RNA polymerase sigma factor [Anaerovoracaceae bacterium]